MLPHGCCSSVLLASITSHQTSTIQRQFHLPESWADSWLDFSKPLRCQEKLQVADRQGRTSREAPEDLSEELRRYIKKGGGYFVPFFASAAWLHQVPLKYTGRRSITIPPTTPIPLLFHSSYTSYHPPNCLRQSGWCQTLNDQTRNSCKWGTWVVKDNPKFLPFRY